MKKTTLLRGAMAAALIFCSTGADMADAEHAGAMKKVATGKVLAWLNNPAVIDAVKAQNAKHASIDQAKIDALDKTWRAEAKSSGGPLSSATLGNALSGYLKTVKANGNGLYTEIFVMDNKGLNVGQSDMTSDYWQGDEAKWKKTYLVGKDAMDIGAIKTDKSTQALQSQLSMAITDPASGKVIGAVTVGVNVEMLD